MSQEAEPIVVGNVWMHAATMAKVQLPESARPIDAYMLAVSEQGTLSLIGPYTIDSTPKVPEELRGICIVTTDTPVERIARRLLQASSAGLV